MTKKQENELVREWTKLFKRLKPTIENEFRASDDSDDDKPGMCVTIGYTPGDDYNEYSWGYQTGDNSFTGGAYGHKNWAVVYLYRRSNSVELAKETLEQIKEEMYV